MRREAPRRYQELFNGIDKDSIKLPHEPDWAKECVSPLRDPGLKIADGLIKRLASAGIGSGIHYPVPLHPSECIQRSSGHEKEWGFSPLREKIAHEIVFTSQCIRIYEAISKARIVSEVVNFVSTEQQRSLQPKFA